MKCAFPVDARVISPAQSIKLSITTTIFTVIFLSEAVFKVTTQSLLSYA